MELFSVEESYNVQGDKRNIIAALKRRGYAVVRNERPAGLQPEYEISSKNSKGLVGRLTFSETLPLATHLQIYGPSKAFDKLREFAQAYQARR